MVVMVVSVGGSVGVLTRFVWRSCGDGCAEVGWVCVCGCRWVGE